MLTTVPSNSPKMTQLSSHSRTRLLKFIVIEFVGSMLLNVVNQVIEFAPTFVLDGVGLVVPFDEENGGESFRNQFFVINLIRSRIHLGNGNMLLEAGEFLPKGIPGGCWKKS